ncbi:hypothetical protein GCK32_005410 [Trichostrongylus colubriformis]|uniref:Uncharacterized protein n=1 Tax=Trichostrongylus colubriformis TaxID=6319 RepID=A0AAN8IM16_TRICO
MKPIALIILVLVVHSESFCTRTPYRKKRFGRIANEEIRSFIQRRVHNITDNDCTMTYNVTFDDEEIPFYPFLINRQDKQVFGVVQLNRTNGKYQWKNCQGPQQSPCHKTLHASSRTRCEITLAR